MSESYWKKPRSAAEFEAYWNKRNKASLLRRWSLVERLAKESPSSIIDIGCGIGNLITFTSLATKDNYFGIDISPPMIERARELHPGYQFKVADPMTPLNSPWDLIVAHGFLLHQHDLFLKLHRLVELTRSCLIFDVLVAREGYSRRSPNGYWTRLVGEEEYTFMKKGLEKEFSLEEVKFGEWGDHSEYYLSCRRI